MVKSAMALFLVLLATARLVVEPVEALGCNDLAPAVVQCAPYALGNVAQPSPGCCNESNGWLARQQIGDRCAPALSNTLLDSPM
ncbi:hypothetical protein RJ639_017999 [Escallonia herrerae]|uniref:Bifunctional inhibitor/plant lipid transfer protein/seed storage helical domain-containing protein n=1 Tax=Escallonia herrerae TaxID=1293975 RepID=A0AA88V831_9ASTE|nr:hypothetical protein RJ639_017999 [Escallonia herrerae]